MRPFSVTLGISLCSILRAADYAVDLPGKHHDLKMVSRSNWTMIVPSNDQIIGRFIQSSGTYDVAERDILLSLIKPNSVVVEVGANVGPYSMYIADHIGLGGKLFCFEPFRLLYQILTANVALNGLSNVVTVNSGVADWPVRDFEADGPNLGFPDNYGAATLLDPLRRTWILSNPVKERIHLLPLDSFLFPERIDLIKVDAEGMEYDVLRGARATIKKFTPLLYVENNVADNLTGLKFSDWILNEFNYTCMRPTVLEMHNIIVCQSAQ